VIASAAAKNPPKRLTNDMRIPFPRRLLLRVSLAVGLAAVAAGCEPEQAAAPEPVRPIRGYTVTEVASGQVRRFAGVIEAVDSTSLGFQVGGNVREVRVNQGDTVRLGQVLAVLDREPYEIAVREAQAELQRARAYVAQTRADFERHQRLLAQRAVSQVAFEVAERNFVSAQSQVDVAQARLSLAERDLRNTTLLAPFAGAVAARLVDPFVEVRPGQELFRLDAAGRRQAAIAVPETSIALIAPGMAASVSVPQLPEPMPARVSEIASAAGTGNAFPVKVTLSQPPPSLRPGMTAEVSIVLAHGAGEVSYFVPLAAIVPGDARGEGFVFVLDPVSSTVRRTAVRTSGTLASNMVAVTGLGAGDIVAAAGVSFLRDGQRVTLMAQSDR
jgi:RND family efflux transporter MFP subunit